MSKRKKPKFHCKSEAQKKAIAAYYAKRAAQKKGRTASGHVPQGRTLSTYDKYLSGGQKTGSQKERPVVVIEANTKNDLAVVPLSTRDGSNRTHLRKYQQGQSYFKHYVETQDDEGKAIRVNHKFRENRPEMDVSADDVEFIKDTVLIIQSPCKRTERKLINSVKNKIPEIHHSGQFRDSRAAGVTTELSRLPNFIIRDTLWKVKRFLGETHENIETNIEGNIAVGGYGGRGIFHLHGVSDMKDRLLRSLRSLRKIDYVASAGRTRNAGRRGAG